MKSSSTIRLHIGNAVPHGNESDTKHVIALWQEISGFFSQQQRFSALSGIRGETRPYLIAIDASQILKTLEHAQDQSQAFNGYRMAHIDHADKAVDASLVITIGSKDHPLEEEESYQVATVFLQQLVMAAHIIRPGSIQVLDAHFIGPGAHRFEAQNFDSRIFHGALRAAIDNEWPKLQRHSLETVWRWLEGCQVSETDIAIKGINQVLFTLLKVAEQRHEYSARTVLLVMYQLEVLLDCRQFNSLEPVGHRVRMVLGKIPEAADCLAELHEVRNSLFTGHQPVRRPPLICHNTEKALRDQFDQHHSAVESGTALVLTLLQDLISHQAYSYEFTETFSRR